MHGSSSVGHTLVTTVEAAAAPIGALVVIGGVVAKMTRWGRNALKAVASRVAGGTTVPQTSVVLLPKRVECSWTRRGSSTAAIDARLTATSTSSGVADVEVVDLDVRESRGQLTWSHVMMPSEAVVRDGRVHRSPSVKLPAHEPKEIRCFASLHRDSGWSDGTLTARFVLVDQYGKSHKTPKIVFHQVKPRGGSEPQR